MITTERTKVKMLASVAGAAMPGYGIQADFSHKRGETVELHPELARAWVECGHAVPAETAQTAAKKGK